MNRKKIPVISLLVVAIGLVTGCGQIVRKKAVSSISKVISEHFEVFTSEGDPVLAEAGLAGNLKLLDLLIAEEPDNYKLLLVNAKSYALYSYFFIEGKLLENENRAFNKKRVEQGYLKAISYAERGLKKRYPKVYSVYKSGSARELMQQLEQDNVESKYLFWLAFSIGGYSRLNPNNSLILLKIEKAVVMMKALVKNDENFFYAGPHLFFAVYYSTVPQFAGGDLKKAKKHIEAAYKITKNKLLLVRYIEARYYATSKLDEALFNRQVSKILSSADNILPPARLSNVIAKKWAAVLKSKSDTFF